MDLSSINKLNKANNVAFQGRKPIKDEKGKHKETFYLPYTNIDAKNGEKIGIEFVLLDKVDGQYVLSPNMSPVRYQDNTEEFKNFENGKSTSISIDISALKNQGEYAYRYVVYDKDGKVKKAFPDAVGTRIAAKGKGGEFTIVSTRQGFPVLEGGMEHIFTDSYNIKNPDQDFKRNHFNKAGGTIQGIINKILKSDELDSQHYIMTTPLIGGGTVSPHMYHPANHFHVSEGTGTKKDFMDLQVACFDKGKGYVLDGAFTSQGYEGVQLNHALRWKDSPFKYWFKNPGNDGYALGVIPDDPEARKYTGIRIVNPKHSEDYEYNPEMPTYIQFYDTRLASKDQIEDKGRLIKEYKNKGTKDPYEITTWHDATLCNFFEINPDTPSIQGKTSGTLAEWEKTGKLDSILRPTNLPYSFQRRGLVSGTTGWDGNIDLVKMNLSNQTTNNKNLKRGCNQARNQMFNVAEYWTGEARNAIIMHIADNIKGKTEQERNEYFKTIEKTYHLKDGYLKGLYKNIKLETDKDLYASQHIGKAYEKLNIADKKGSANQIIQETVLNFPLESLDFSPELLGILSTPYITPRPTADSDPKASKLEVLKDATKDKETSELSNSMKEVYTEILPNMIREILSDIQDSENNLVLYKANGDNIGELTPMGKYFVEMARDDIMQFLISGALFGIDGIPEVKDGNLDFDGINNKAKHEGNEKYLNFKKLGIYESTSKREADAVAKKLKQGLLELKGSEDFRNLKDYLKTKYASCSVNDYKVAEAIVDKTGTGLNWRFDAAKDVGDWEETKEGLASAETVFKDIISFWKPFVKRLRGVNESSYVVAEMTSLWDFQDKGWGKFINPDVAEKTFYEETGATTGSNYSTFFGAYPKLFGKNIEEGAVQNYRSINSFLQKTKDFCSPWHENGHSSAEFMLGSHVFLDNHDKPRAAHLMGVDAAFFWGDFKHRGDKERVENILGMPYNDKMNSKAAAVAEKYLEYFDKEADKLGASEDDKKALQEAILHLARGSKYNDLKDKSLNFKRADSFGQTPYEITVNHVIELAEDMGLSFDEEKQKTLANEVFADMVAPYESKMAAIYEMMTGTVGIPTIFAGDEFVQTGCETKSKNWALGCRNLIRHDWINPKNKTYKEHVRRFNTHLKQTGLLGKSSLAMSALSNGTPIVIEHFDINHPVGDATKEQFIKGIKTIINDERGWNGGKINNVATYLGFLDCIKRDGKDAKTEDIVAELNKMDRDDIINAYTDVCKKENYGTSKWFSTYITGTQTGAVVKYNDKGSTVVTMMTNAFMTEEPEVAGLMQKSPKAPFVNCIKLVDDNGNKIAQEGSIFVRKTYDEKQGKYVDDGEYRYSANGTLEAINGSKTKLDSTTTYFYKKIPEAYRTY